MRLGGEERAPGRFEVVTFSGPALPLGLYDLYLCGEGRAPGSFEVVTFSGPALPLEQTRVQIYSVNA